VQEITTSAQHQGPEANGLHEEKRQTALSLSRAVILLRSGPEMLISYSRLKSCDMVDGDNKQLQKTAFA